jgi:hypothetical protein
MLSESALSVMDVLWNGIWELSRGVNWEGWSRKWLSLIVQKCWAYRVPWLWSSVWLWSCTVELDYLDFEPWLRQVVSHSELSIEDWKRCHVSNLSRDERQSISPRNRHYWVMDLHCFIYNRKELLYLWRNCTTNETLYYARPKYRLKLLRSRNVGVARQTARPITHCIRVWTAKLEVEVCWVR